MICQARAVHLAPKVGAGSVLQSRPGTELLCLQTLFLQPSGISVLPFAGALASVADLHVGATPGALLHGAAGMAPPGMLGLGPIASHGASVSTTAWAGELERGSSRAGVPHSHPDLCLLLWPLQMNQIPVGGQPSSGLQDASQLYSPASQTQLPLPPGTQQVTGACGGALDSETRIPALGWPGTSPSLSLLPGNTEIAFPMPVSWSHSWGSLKPLQGTETGSSPGAVDFTSC